MRLRPLFRRFRSELLHGIRFVAMTGVITGLVAGAAWGAYSELLPAVIAHSYFRLRSVKVVCDSAAGEPASLAARAGLYDGTSLWEIDTHAATRALASVRGCGMRGSSGDSPMKWPSKSSAAIPSASRSPAVCPI